MVDGPRARLENEAHQARDLDIGSSWSAIPKAFRSGQGFLPAPWEAIFGPLRTGAIDDLVVVGQCGQSLDGRIATVSGDSHYINDESGLDHLHRLRALVDVVVIGVGTAIADDPQLTVRRVQGPNPARAIIDPYGRLPLNARALAADGTRKLVITAAATARRLPDDIEVIALAPEDGRLAPAAIIGALAKRAFQRILIEGGAETLSRFLTACCLDRLHIVVAPIILGGGRPSFSLPPLQRLEEARRLPMRALSLPAAVPDGTAGSSAPDVLLDCDLSAQRALIGRAKIST